MRSWSDPAWAGEAERWITDTLAHLELAPAGPIERSHVAPWSTALRVPVADGDVWFKANMPSLAYEAAVVDVLARSGSGAVPELLAVDRERGWLLTADAGLCLRDVIARERSLRRWLDVLPRYGQLQLDTVGFAGELLAAGVPRCGLDELPHRYAGLLDVVRGLSGEESGRLRNLLPAVQAMCDELAAHGVPETIQHDDLHDGQVYVHEGGYVIADWAESCVSHPFFTMAVTLEGVIAWGLDDVRNSVDVAPFADAYLEPFTSYGRPRELRAALAAARRLGWICRALTAQRWASALDPPVRDEHLDGVGVRLRMFLSA